MKRWIMLQTFHGFKIEATRMDISIARVIDTDIVAQVYDNRGTRTTLKKEDFPLSIHYVESVEDLKE